MAEETQGVVAQQPAPPVKPPRRAPRGFNQVTVDKVFRFKVPSKLVEYLNAVTDPHVFVTEYEGHVRIFFNGAFERFLDRIREKNAALAKKIAEDCELRGSDVDIDGSGRLTIPPPARKHLGPTEKSYYLRADNDVVTVYNEQEYKQMAAESDTSAAANAELVRQLGIEL